MQLDPDDCTVRDLYSWMIGLIAPRPIAWVSTLSAAGVVNLAPFSFSNAVGCNPPLLMFCPANRRDGSPKDSLLNVEQTGEFVVNVVTEDLVEQMNASSGDWRADISEFSACEVPPAPSVRVQPPRVANARASFECRLVTAMRLGAGPAGSNLVLGRVVMMHLDETLANAGPADVGDMLEPLGRMGGQDFARTRDRFTLKRPEIPASQRRVD